DRRGRRQAGRRASRSDRHAALLRLQHGGGLRALPRPGGAAAEGRRPVAADLLRQLVPCRPPRPIHLAGLRREQARATQDPAAGRRQGRSRRARLRLLAALRGPAVARARLLARGVPGDHGDRPGAMARGAAPARRALRQAGRATAAGAAHRAPVAREEAGCPRRIGSGAAARPRPGGAPRGAQVAAWPPSLPAVSRMAIRIAATRLRGSALPLPAMSKAVPWSGLVRTNGRPIVTFTPSSRPRYFTGISPWSWYMATTTSNRAKPRACMKTVSGG